MICYITLLVLEGLGQNIEMQELAAEINFLKIWFKKCFHEQLINTAASLCQQTEHFIREFSSILQEEKKQNNNNKTSYYSTDQ